MEGAGDKSLGAEAEWAITRAIKEDRKAQAGNSGEKPSFNQLPSTTELLAAGSKPDQVTSVGAPT